MLVSDVQCSIHCRMIIIVSHLQLFATIYNNLNYWSGLPFPFSGDLPNPGVEAGSPAFRQILYLLHHQGRWPPLTV